MRRPYQILMPLFSLFLVRVDLTDFYPIEMEVEVVKILDGDTVSIKKGSFEHNVRLAKIDTPEKGQPFLSGGGDAGEYSKRCLKKLLAKKGRLVIFGIDIYGRILGDIDRVTFKMIQAGCAPLYPHSKFESFHEKFLYLMARREKRGLWSKGGIQQPKKYRKTKKFSRRISHQRLRQ
jgi:endonuclease YncB( thermonuclease family)